MIIEFSIKNFGPIKEEQTLSFEAGADDKLSDYYVMEHGGLRLLKVALIYGANASGKTTVLKALNFLRDIVLDPIKNKKSNLDFEPYLFDANTPKENSVLTLKFLKDIKYEYNVVFNKQAIVKEELYHFANRKTKIYSRTTDFETQFARIEIGSTIKIDKELKKTLEANTLWNNTVLGGYMKTNIEFSQLKEVTDWFKYHLRPIIQPRNDLTSYITKRINEGDIPKNDVVTILRKADFYISDIRIENVEEEIPEHIFNILKQEGSLPAKGDGDGLDERKITISALEFEHTVNNQKYMLPLRQESEGTKRYYQMAGLMVQLINRPGILMIDELESSLHPDLFEHFMLIFLNNTKQSQLIATTHYREFLNDRNLYRDDVIWFTDNERGCATKLYSLVDFDSSVVRNTSNVLNAYKSGKLGATPNTGDAYINLE